MRPFVRWVISVTLLIAACSPLAFAQSAREQLNQLTQELRVRPADEALRERIVRLGAGIKPPPPIPEESYRRMARGMAALAGAKTPADYQTAVSEFEAAASAAPWWGDAYFNWGIALDKAGRTTEAVSALRFAILAAPDSREAKNLLYQLEFRAEQQAKQQDKERAQSARGHWARQMAATLNSVFGSGRIIEEIWCIVNDKNLCSETEARGRNWLAVPHSLGETIRIEQSPTDPTQIELHKTRNNYRDQPLTWAAQPSGPNPDTDIASWTCAGKSREGIVCDEKPVRMRFTRHTDGTRGMEIIAECFADKCYRRKYIISP